MSRLLRVSLGGLILVISAFASAYEPPAQIIFGGDGAYPPFEWLDEGQPKGFNIDLAQTLTQTGGSTAVHQLGDWPDTIRALQRGDVHVVPMFISPEREEHFLFTSPFYYLSHAIYAHEDTPPVYAVANLANKRVVVEESSFAHSQFAVEGIDPVLVLARSTADAVGAVAAGEVDYALLAAPIADRLIASRNLPLTRLGPPVWSRGYAFAVRKDRAALRAWLQEALDTTIKTGRYQAVYDEWENDLNPTNADLTVLLRLAALVGFGLAVLAAAAFAWSWSLRRQVKAKTQRLRESLDRVKTAEAQARRLADYDTETGLAKPQHFMALVDQRLTNRGHDGAELLILKPLDLNQVTGTFGQAYSDELIHEFGQTLQACTRDPCGYFGRGVFAIFSDRAAIQSAFERLSDHRSSRHYAPLIAGSACYPEHGESSVELVLRAEMALALAGGVERQWSVYNPAMEPDPIDLDIVAAFREGQVEGLSSAFQPQVHLGTGEIMAAEALVRWIHPTHGPISPATFIPLIEKAGLVSQVTERMIDEAAKLAGELRGRDRAIAISVNVAISDFKTCDLPALIVEAAKRHGARPSDIKLEVTETSFASDSEPVKDILVELKALGVTVSIDDFGTGYSSLSYLSMFPIQELKIDRVFVYDMLSNEKHRCIVRSTILMARELGLKTIAEGVEDHETIDALRREGCDGVQGFAIAKPLTRAEFLDFMESNAGRGLSIAETGQ